MQNKPASNPSGLAHVPPQAIDVEEAVLAQMMMEKNVAAEAMVLLPYSQIFYVDKHALVYEAIKSLSDKNDPIDLLTITQELRSTGKLELAGGSFYVTQLSTKANSAVHLEKHCRILLEKFIRRIIIQVSTKQLAAAYAEDVDVFESLNKAQQDLIRVQEALQTRKAVDGISLLKETLTAIEEAGKTPGGITGVKCGLTDVDKVTAGWQGSDLIIFAGRPGMGKTALAMVCGRNAVVEDKKPTLVFSREMPRQQLMTRLVAAETGISNATLRRGNLEEHEWAALHHKVAKLYNKDLYIDDSARTIEEMRSKSITMVAKHGIKLIIIDYLQICRMAGNYGNREQEIAAMTRALKELAKELNVPVIALSQLSRQVENRPDKRPTLSDLRESGAIEQDADIVIFCYRPEYYNILEDEKGNSLENLMDIIFAKHRNGATPTVTVSCNMMYSRIFDLVEAETEQQLPATKPGYNPNKFTEPSKTDEEEPF